jgi:hypothetical protein
VSAITCKNMFRHPQICISHLISPWEMNIGIVGLMISCMKGQETYTRFKVKCNKKKNLRSTTPLGEETSILAVDSEEEDEEVVWVEAEDKSYYNYTQPGHLERVYYSPCTTCSYYNSFEHVIEECLALLAKLQEKQRPQQNP